MNQNYINCLFSYSQNVSVEPFAKNFEILDKNMIKLITEKPTNLISQNNFMCVLFYMKKNRFVI